MKLFVIVAITVALYGSVQARTIESATEAYSGERTTYDWGKHTVGYY